MHNDARQSVGLLWASDELVAETSTWQHTTLTTDKFHAPGGIRTHNLRRRTAADLRLRWRGNEKIKHRNWSLNHTVTILNFLLASSHSLKLFSECMNNITFPRTTALGSGSMSTDQ